MVHHCFLRTAVSLLRVYLVEGYCTSVELPILTTHLHRGDSGLHEQSSPCSAYTGDGRPSGEQQP